MDVESRPRKDNFLHIAIGDLSSLPSCFDRNGR